MLGLASAQICRCRYRCRNPFIYDFMDFHLLERCPAGVALPPFHHAPSCREQQCHLQMDHYVASRVLISVAGVGTCEVFCARRLSRSCCYVAAVFRKRLYSFRHLRIWADAAVAGIRILQSKHGCGRWIDPSILTGWACMYEREMYERDMQSSCCILIFPVCVNAQMLASRGVHIVVGGGRAGA